MNKKFIISGLITTILIVSFVFLISDKTKEFSIATNSVNLLLVILAYFPAFLVSFPVLNYLNLKEVLTQSYLSRILRVLLLSPLFLLLITFLINIMRLLIYQSIDDDPFTSHKVVMGLIISGIILVFSDFYLFDRNHKLILLKIEKDKNKKLRLKNEALKNQMNPHFLFNSLNVLGSLTLIDPKKANHFTKELSRLYRYVLRTANQDLVPLDKEIDFIQSYCNILHIRFGNQIDIKLKGEVAEGEIVPLALQMLIENAQKHNKFSQHNPLNIDILISAKQIQVINSLYPTNGLKEGGAQFGLRYIREMYSRIGRSITVEKNDSCFSVTIPIIDRNESNYH